MTEVDELPELPKLPTYKSGKMIGVYLPKETYDDLLIILVAEGVTLSEWCRNVLVPAIKRRREELR